MRHRLTRLASAAGVVGLLLAVVPVSNAAAHATFVSMSPTDGSVVATAPTEVVVTFNQPIQDIGTVLVVRAPSGTPVADGAPVVVDNTVTQRLVPLSETGTYAVAFRVTSTDGHPVSKQLTFSLRERSTAGAVTSPATEAASTTSSSAIAWLAIGVVLVVIAVILTLLVRRRRQGDPVARNPYEPGEEPL